jgi:hypothetical protein
MTTCGTRRIGSDEQSHRRNEVMATLSGFGKSGKWTVEIDDEGSGNTGVAWSITLRHPAITIQYPISDLTILTRLVDYLELLANCQSTPFVVGGYAGTICSITVSEDRLIFALQREHHLAETRFPFLMECIVELREVTTLIDALRDAVADQAT